MYLGIDVSSIDKSQKVDWQKVKSTGCLFAIFRGTYNTWVDPSWSTQAQKAKDAGLTVGAYLFPVMSKKAPSAAQQVAAFVKTVGPLTEKEFPPVLDVEFAMPGISSTERSRPELLVWIREAVAELKKAYGISPIIYTSARIWDGEDPDALNIDALGATPELLECPLWLARYPYRVRIDAVGDSIGEKRIVESLPLPPVPKAWGPENVWIHQYQGNALSFPGFSLPVDLNRFFDLRRGSNGERVKWLQRKLTNYGFLEIDGLFGPRTHSAVCLFQLEKDLIVDGIVGPKTFAALCWVR
jgi:GH25 family lysozyme M1 (1,4-beta-N-acetylmuramidase)